MTVQELFRSVGFDAVVKALQNTHRNDRSIRSLAGYKEAFDTLCNIKFEGKGGTVTFDVTPREHWFDEHNLPMLARNVEGDFWENIVGKDVVRPEDNPFTDAELAGSILWGATFLGFTRHSRVKLHEDSYTQYGEKAHLLERKLYIPYLRDKQTIRKLRNFSVPLPHGIAFSFKEWDRIHYCEKHQNRAKRKRFYRLDTQIKHLKQLDNRWHLINGIKTKTGVPQPQWAEKILHAGSIREAWRESHVYGQGDRLAYLIDLITNYPPHFDAVCNDGDEMLIIAYGAENNPVSDREIDAIKQAITSKTASRNISWQLLQGIDNATGDELALQLIGIRKQEMEDKAEGDLG